MENKWDEVLTVNKHTFVYAFNEDDGVASTSHKFLVSWLIMNIIRNLKRHRSWQQLSSPFILSIIILLIKRKILIKSFYIKYRKFQDFRIFWLNVWTPLELHAHMAHNFTLCSLEQGLQSLSWRVFMKLLVYFFNRCDVERR